MEGRFYFIIYLLAIALLFSSCNDQFSGSLFKSQYPHQRYLAQLDKAAIDHSKLYRQWQEAATRSLTDPATITVPYQESAYIAPSHPDAMGYLFSARQGERLVVDVSVQSQDSVQLFIDLFEFSSDTSSDHKHLVSADTGRTDLTWDTRVDGRYILRIQPELLADVSFDLRITAEASLASPVVPGAKQHIGSVFGDPRDGGKRLHEGIDIFAARRTPVIAAANGTIDRVGDNRLGGKVLWLRPKDRQISLYYAHLDTQLVSPGQAVAVGDTLGLMGNTGNARTTPPHLHFGIYAPGGAVDPLPFVRPGKSNPPKILADIARLGDTLRLVRQDDAVASRHTPVVIEAASRNGYRIVLPDQSRHFLERNQITSLTRLRTTRLDKPRILYAQADTSSARITSLPAGKDTQVIGEHGDFLLLGDPFRGWILR